ncbi:DUF192 domain-containing protein [Rhizobium sp. L1K21]|uniref:DUF192 domain-containing protein n=1 Tax=Rhizobium sp. L1K21 TaxID=2954933 RepID=UPI002092F985|nr:DUF192 domain-containing protein [Rhizobium sp. L1K21]MCO6185958.1 DUF192 domain-containing protein [Rhizobium sp. L1K21]
MARRFLANLSKSALVALLLFLAPLYLFAAGEMPVLPLSVTGPDGKVHMFSVEVASTPSERERGLMHRETMEDDQGMLFAFPKVRRVTMWMENTLIGLDMLFIDESGRVIRVKHNARPMDRSIIDSGGDVSHVLEINAGLATRLGIAEGSTVQGEALQIKSSH